MSDFQKWQEKKVDKKREKKKQAKLKKTEDKEMGRMSEKEVAEFTKQKAQLEMLIGDRKTSEKNAVVDKADQRFQTGDNAFAVDPTHREFKKVVHGHNKVVKRQSHHKHKSH